MIKETLEKILHTLEKCCKKHIRMVRIKLMKIKLKII